MVLLRHCGDCWLHDLQVCCQVRCCLLLGRHGQPCQCCPTMLCYHCPTMPRCHCLHHFLYCLCHLFCYLCIFLYFGCCYFLHLFRCLCFLLCLSDCCLFSLLYLTYSSMFHTLFLLNPSFFHHSLGCPRADGPTILDLSPAWFLVSASSFFCCLCIAKLVLENDVLCCKDNRCFGDFV